MKDKIVTFHHRNTRNICFLGISEHNFYYIRFLRFSEQNTCLTFSEADGLQERKCIILLCINDGATLAFCENGFCRNLKTNEVKYIKLYIFRKEILQGVYLNSQIFG